MRAASPCSNMRTRTTRGKRTLRLTGPPPCKSNPSRPRHLRITLCTVRVQQARAEAAPTVSWNQVCPIPRLSACALAPPRHTLNGCPCTGQDPASPNRRQVASVVRMHRAPRHAAGESEQVARHKTSAGTAAKVAGTAAKVPRTSTPRRAKPRERDSLANSLAGSRQRAGRWAERTPS
jgi:hypothetical protein